MCINHARGSIRAKCSNRSLLTESGESLLWLSHRWAVPQARIDELAARLAMAPAQFADNLEGDFMVNEVQNQPGFPIEQAEVYVSEVCPACIFPGLMLCSYHAQA